MKRRGLLWSGLAAGTQALLGGCAAPPVERADDDDADRRLVDRLGWGANETSLADCARRGRRGFVEAQLRPGPLASLPPAVQAQIDGMTISREPLDQLARRLAEQRRAVDALADDEAKQAARRAWQQEMTRVAHESASRTLLRAVHSPQQLWERMTWFWGNHFSVYQYRQDVRVFVGDYQDQALRPHALGRFRDLLIASATHPAMLRYLDNAQNAAGRLNENYARELMELHTLGIDGGYTQQDVQDLARVLTGLGVRLRDAPPARRAVVVLRPGLVEFDPARHDGGEKTVLGQRIAAGQGWGEILAQLALLSRQPATAHHVAQRLATAFVADAPPPALVQRTAARFLASDGDIAATLQTMFEAPEFEASLGGRFKDPMQFVVSAVRLVHEGQPVLDGAPMIGWLNRLGEAPWNHPTPEGYALEASTWAGSGQLATRFEIARAIAAGGARLATPPLPGEAGEPGAPGEAVEAMARPAAVADVSMRRAGADAMPLRQPADGETPRGLPRPPATPGLAADGGRPVPPRALRDAAIVRTLGPATREALAEAASPLQWNALLLSSPEFMRC